MAFIGAIINISVQIQLNKHFLFCHIVFENQAAVAVLLGFCVFFVVLGLTIAISPL
ncbi:hypothetical protein AALB_1314 [Agarivorans albus MKT 106]|uniref:Uncharacterized protein n=1 Tax=Agarivorans albus MKT 106 TaxID=1331007 RepID=R9PIM6_AGAAL|nr:hypothetical protein AALB_1314 [Agarivorans albus MKT 106]